MKRTMSMALIIGLFATAASAASVTSENTVGYITPSNVAGGFIMKTAPFSVVGDETIPLTLDEALVGDFAAGDKAYVWDPSIGTSGDYKIFQYSDDLFDPGVPGFVGPGWGNLSGFVVDLSLPTGQGFWVTSAASMSYTTAGQVRESQVSLSTPAGTFSMLGNPYPADVSLNDITMTGIAAGDQIYVWDPTLGTSGDYKIFQYSDDLFDPGVPGFVGPGWGNLSGFVVNDAVIPVGSGFWISTASAAQLDFPTVL